ncbi:Uncharacterized protein Fot_27625 [Forsythia ovata]|uniref:Uncharacterized protein n=1 Tax=Forsythia ovata TaxID=205694 RepID=A0ABD1TLV0_9LAMI
MNSTSTNGECYRQLYDDIRETTVVEVVARGVSKGDVTSRVLCVTASGDSLKEEKFPDNSDNGSDDEPILSLKLRNNFKNPLALSESAPLRVTERDGRWQELLEAAIWLETLN